MNVYFRLFWSCLPGVLVLLLITAFFLWLVPYRIVGDNLLGAESSLMDGFTLAASCRSSWREFRLSELERFFPMQLVVQVRARLRDVRRGVRGWQTARADLKFYDCKNKELRKFRCNIMSEVGSHDWQGYSRRISIPDMAREGRLLLQNAGSSGSVSFAGLTVCPAVPRRFFAWGWWGMLALWISALSAYLFNLAKKLLRKRGALAWAIIMGLLIILILAGVATPHNTLMSAWNRGANLPALDQVKKWGHFYFFTILAMTAMWIHRRQSDRSESFQDTRSAISCYISVFAYLLLFAMATEVLQFFSISRVVSVLDWLMNAAGIALGLLLHALVGRLIRRAKKGCARKICP